MWTLGEISMTRINYKCQIMLTFLRFWSWDILLDGRVPLSYLAQLVIGPWVGFAVKFRPDPRAGSLVREGVSSWNEENNTYLGIHKILKYECKLWTLGEISMTRTNYKCQVLLTFLRFSSWDILLDACVPLPYLVIGPGVGFAVVSLCPDPASGSLVREGVSSLDMLTLRLTFLKWQDGWSYTCHLNSKLMMKYHVIHVKRTLDT